MTKNILIIGLGNPGKKYEHSPHNAGFAVIDMLAKKMEERGIYMKEEKFAEVWKGTLWDAPVALVKPTSFMNKSGLALQSLTIPPIPSHMWLVHDDIDLPLGTLRIVQNRGSAGHKGVQSVIDMLGTKNFVRFRVGIRPQDMPQRRSKALMQKFVVGRYTPHEKNAFIVGIGRCVEAIHFALENDVEKAMAKYNT